MVRRLFLLGVLAIGAGVAAVLYGRAAPAGGARPVEAAPLPVVAVAVAERRDVPVALRGIGTVEPFNTVLVRSRVDGLLLRVRFEEGQAVRAGDPLFEIDPSLYRTQLALAAANLERDRAQLGNAETELGRTTGLLGHGYASRQAFDQNNSRREQFQAAVKADQAMVEAARLQLDYTVIRAPMSGRIGKRLVDEGNLVRAADGTTLAQIVQLRPIAVAFTAPQAELPAIRGQAGAVAVTALSTEAHKVLAAGRLVLVGNEVDRATGTIPLKAVFDNADGALWPGQFVETRLVEAVRRDAVLLPEGAVQDGPDGSYVYVVAADSTVLPRRVQATPTGDGVSLVERGIAAGERVVTQGQERLAAGMRVAVDPPEAALR